MTLNNIEALAAKNVMPNSVTLFLIDDDDIDVIDVERSFKRLNIENQFVRAHDGEEALSMLNAQAIMQPFVILLDLQMPRMNGLEFLAALRAHLKYKNSVVFILTTSSEEQDIAQSYDLNVAGYFVKNECGRGFLDVLEFLQGYWKVVHLPSSSMLIESE